MVHTIPEMGMSEMSDATNVRNGGMSRRVSEVSDLIDTMTIVPEGAAVDFVGKLAAEQEWPIGRASRAYDEYRRFLLLAWISPGMVVPSHDVDQAWHLHLTHSRHYWDVLCGTILQKPFHHDPSQGGESEDARHGGAYLTTLALYRHVYGEEAPHDVWPRGCGCASRSAEATETQHTVLASPPYVGITILGAVPAMIALMSGHPWIAMCIVGIAIAFAIVATAADNEEKERERIRLSRQVRPSGTARDADYLAEPSYASHSSASWTGTGSSRRSTAHRNRSVDASSSGKSSSMDSSGQDTGLAFMALMASDNASASTASGHGSHGHSGSGSSHSTSSHSSHSCSSSSSSHSNHSSHSCGSSSSHSCSSSSSSCGGSSCGGGGCGGS